MHIGILYEDDAVLVIDKPAGMTVNRAETTRHEETVQDWVEARYKRGNAVPIKQQVSYGEEGWSPEIDFYNRGGIVHRLDKETSGILLLAKTPQSFVILQKQFKERVVEKTYIALAHGKLVPPTGEIRVPVDRLPWNRTQFGVVPGGRESVTFYSVLDYLTDQKELYSYLELNPKTGRTHQIRVHLKYIGHPIFADFLYAGRKTARNDRKILKRVFLHAAKISFLHPTSHTTVSFSSPLPEELASVLKKLERVVS